MRYALAAVWLWGFAVVGCGGDSADAGNEGTTHARADAPTDAAVDPRAADTTIDVSGEAGSVDASDAEGTDASAANATGIDASNSDAGATDASGSDTGGAEAGTDADIDSGATVDASVLQHHKNATRDGFYVDPALTKTAIHTMHLDTAFSAATTGQTFSQPLLMAGGVHGQDALYVATENNDVFALDPKTGAQLWTTPLGTAVTSGLACGGSISPLGVTGTPIIDPVGRAIYMDAAIGGSSPKHTIFSLSVDTGKVNWSLDVSATIAGFDSTVQNQRGALALVGGKLFVPYGGLDGDCGNYKGWVVAVPVNAPTAATGWSTPAPSGAGIWSPSGVASDGTSLFVTTGNTNGSSRPAVWANAQSEAILKLSTAPAFSGNSTDYFAPTDWLAQDQGDADLCSSGVVLFDAPGTSPPHLAFAIGKTSVGRLVDQTNLGGVGDGVSNLASNGQVFGTLFAYTSAQATYVGMSTTFPACSDGDFSVLKVSSTAQLSFAWCATSGGAGGPISSSTSANGSTDSIVWSFGAAGDGILRAWDADTGANLFTAAAAVAGNVQHWTSPIIANGRIYVAGDGSVYAFTL